MKEDLTLKYYNDNSEGYVKSTIDVDMKETITNEMGQKEVISHPYMEGTKLGNYLKSAHYADKAIGQFLTDLDNAGLLENTVIVFYGDHDARLPQDDYVRLYNYNPETDDMLYLDNLLRA